MKPILGGIDVKQNFDAEAERVALANMRRIVADTGPSNSATDRLRLDSARTRSEGHDLQVMREFIQAAPQEAPTDMLVLFEDQRVEGRPSYKRLKLTDGKVANSAEAPPVKRSHVVEIAEKIIDERLTLLKEERVEAPNPEPSIEMIANVFATEAGPLVEETVAKIAPDYIVQLVDQIAPKMLDEVVEKTATEVLLKHLPEHLGPEIDTRVAQTLKTELQGTLGHKVTEKIRLLIHAEVMAMAQSGQI